MKDRKRAAHPSSIRTRRLSLPIISSLAALSARWPFHPRTPLRSFVSLLGACLWESGEAALMLARFYTSPPCRTSGATTREAFLLLPEMILRLSWRVVNPKKSRELDPLDSNRSGGGFWNPIRVSARVFVSANTVVALEIVENYKATFLLDK